MKFGDKPRKEWSSARDITLKFNPINNKLNRLMVLSNVWQKLTGIKSKYWVLDTASKDTIYVKVKVSAAKHELAGQSVVLIKELNKYFDKPWIKRIEII